MFVDEAGCDHKNAMQRFGYSLRGYPAKAFQFLSLGKRFSITAAMTSTTFLDCYTVEGSVDRHFITLSNLLFCLT